MKTSDQPGFCSPAPIWYAAAGAELSVVRIDASLFPHYDPGMAPGSQCNGTKDCPECSRLRSSRELRQLIYAIAASRLKSIETRMDGGQWTALQRKSLEAEIDLMLVDAQIAQHQDRQTVPN